MKRLLLLLWLAALPLHLAGQEYQAPEVKVSTEKVRIGEKLYLVHKVQPKQTVFSICKAYGITADDLVVANPDVKAGLKAGAILYIPTDSASVAVDSTAIARAVAVEEPLQGDDAQNDAPTRVIEHRVRLFDSARSIARKYGITADELLDYNGLSAKDLSTGMIILVPIHDPDQPDEGDDGSQGDPEDEESVTGKDKPEEPMPPVRKVRWFSLSEPLRIALILPFNATSGHASPSFLNFYCGALMAVQDQKEQGAHVVLNVFDLSQGAEAILSDPKFEGCDLIVGPVEAATMDPFLRFSDERGIPFVSPLDHKADSLVEAHAFFFQVPASPKVQAANLVSGIRPGLHERVVLVKGPAADSVFLGQVESALRHKDITYRTARAGELPGMIPSYSSRLTTTKVIIGTEDKTVATEAVRNLNALAKKNVPVELHCTNRVRNYETSDPDALFNVAAHIPAPYFVDYSDPKDQAFVLQYRALFSAEPDDFAFQGYDVLAYFIAAMNRYGTGFTDNADAFPQQLLHCNFQFQRPDEKSGWRNSATRNIVYDREDFSISIVK